jgi:hypothetical protein
MGDDPRDTPPPPFARAGSLVTAYLVALLCMGGALRLAIDTPTRPPLDIARMVLCAAGWPVLLAAASVVRHDVLFQTAGPLMGLASIVVWLLAAFVTLRRRPVHWPTHLVLAFGWLILGTLVLLKTFSK